MGRKIGKIVGAVFLALAIATTQIPVTNVNAEEADDINSVNDPVDSSLVQDISDVTDVTDGTLADLNYEDDLEQEPEEDPYEQYASSLVDTSIFSDYELDGTTLVSYTGTSSDVSIPASVKRIQAECFKDNNYIRRVAIGNNVRLIGEGAFEGCTNLESVYIADSVETIDQAAFADCKSLRNVSIGRGLLNLGNGVFAGDISLSNVDFSRGNERFLCNDGAIYNYTKEGSNTLYQVLAGRNSQDYSMPDSVTTIKPYAFWGYKNLKNVAISSNVNRISGYAFSNCSNIQAVDIPYSVTSIDLKAFENCIRLTTINIPISVSNIHSTAFDGCPLVEIVAEPGSFAASYADALVRSEINLREYEDTELDTIEHAEDLIVEGEEDEDDYEEAYYHEVTRMDPTSDDGDGAAKSRILNGQVYVMINNASATVHNGAGDVLGNIGTGETGETIDSLNGSDSLDKQKIVAGKIIADKAYYEANMTIAEIPAGIEEIGEFAFARSSVMNAVIPNTVKSIDYAAFYHCDRLEDVSIPASVEYIGPSAFDKTPFMENWLSGGAGDYLIVGDGILLAYKGNSSEVTIPQGVKTIAPGAFYNHDEITSVIFNPSTIYIGEGAFEACDNLASISGFNNVVKIADRAFCECPIREIVIPQSVQEIGLKAFDQTEHYSVDSRVIFEGNELPLLSFESSASKLYNEDLRGLAFNGVNIAYVQPSVNDLSGTILDPEISGFEGIVVTRDYENENLSVICVQNHGESISNYADNLVLNGTYYEIDKVNAPANSKPVDMAEGVYVTVDSKTLSHGSASAVLDGAKGAYSLIISESDSASDTINYSFENVYGKKTPAGIKTYDISLYDANSGVLIDGLGKQYMTISMPLPKSIESENLHIVCSDRNGQLEELEYTLSEDGTVSFSINHFSAFAFYNAENLTNTNSTVLSDVKNGVTAIVKDGGAVFESLSGGPNGEGEGPFHIHYKWYLCLLCLLASLCSFIFIGKKRTSLNK